jgi:hypothetical protein
MMQLLFSTHNLRLLAWLGFYGLMLLAGYDRYYLADWQRFSVWLGGGILLLVYLLSAAAGRRRSLAQTSTQQLGRGIETASHFAPLFILLALGPTTLSGSLPGATLGEGTMQALSRAREHAGQPVERSTSGQPHTSLPAPGTTPGQSAAAPGAGFRETNLLDLYMAQEHTEGEAVEVVGMLHKLQGGKVDWLPPEVDQSAMHGLVYRYLISCCVADALPLTIVLEDVSEQALAGMPQDGWIRVRGRLKKLNRGSLSPLLALQVVEFEATEVPDSPYLSLYPLKGPGSKVIDHGQ